MLSIFMSLLISCDNNKQASQEANKINTPSSSNPKIVYVNICLLYTSDAADERSSVDLGGRRIIKKKKKYN